MENISHSQESFDYVTKALNEVINNEQYMFDKQNNKIVQGMDDVMKRNFVENAINYLKQILNKWDKDSRLIISGSLLLNAQIFDSDIDCLVVLPNKQIEINNWEIIFEEKFFGKISNKCNIKLRKCEEEENNNNSLYCLLCKDVRIQFIKKIPGRVPLIKINFLGYDFDLIFILFSKNLFNQFNSIYQNNKQPKINEIDDIIAKFVFELGGPEEINNGNNKHFGMVLALSGYRSNLQINLMTEYNKHSFRLALLTLKVWAKNNYIYGTQYGFFGGPALSIILCYILNLYGNNVPPPPIFILLKNTLELFTFRFWNSPLMLEIPQNYLNIRNLLDWNLNKESENRLKLIPTNLRNYLIKHSQIIWPIITPGFPTQNVLFNINDSTSQIIERQVNKGLQKLVILQDNINQNKPLWTVKNLWVNFLKKEKFEEKYKHYLCIVCSYSNKSEYGSDFCDFVGTRIRLQLLFSIEILPFISFCHLNPKKLKKRK
uniref:polynucleotide adenylyltransferase n=1 Tax=Meloidogyne enterolobii TaxID=390850 RepID=A0A6V7VAM4_MELEN|nr:unnamed protein product [Meloidogyne enterolobii]